MVHTETHWMMFSSKTLPSVPFSTQVYKWVLANLMLGAGNLRWTSIPSRGSRNTPNRPRLSNWDELRLNGPLAWRRHLQLYWCNKLALCLCGTVIERCNFSRWSNHVTFVTKRTACLWSNFVIHSRGSCGYQHFRYWFRILLRKSISVVLRPYKRRLFDVTPHIDST